MVNDINLSISGLGPERKKKAYSVYLDVENVNRMKKEFGIPVSKMINDVFKSIIESVEARKKLEAKDENKPKEKSNDGPKKVDE